jgi:hypothetical protein
MITKGRRKSTNIREGQPPTLLERYLGPSRGEYALRKRIEAKRSGVSKEEARARASEISREAGRKYSGNNPSEAVKKTHARIPRPRPK